MKSEFDWKINVCIVYGIIQSRDVLFFVLVHILHHFSESLAHHVGLSQLLGLQRSLPVSRYEIHHLYLPTKVRP